MKILIKLALAATLSAGAATAQTPGTFTKLGTGCGPLVPPELTCPQPPNIGKVCEVRVENLTPNQEGLIIAGISDKVWTGVTLPLDLSFLGAPGCTLYSSGECLGLCFTNQGDVTMLFGIPIAPSLVGFEFFAQFLTPAPGANAANLSISNGGKFVIGDQ